MLWIRLKASFVFDTNTASKLSFSGTLQSLPLEGTHANIARRADLNLCIGASMTSTRRPNPICCYHCRCLYSNYCCTFYCCCAVYSPAPSLPAESSPGFLAGFLLQRRLEAAVGRGSYFLPYSSSSHVLVLRLYLCSLRVSQVSCSFSSLVFVRLPTRDWQLW